MTSFDCEMPFQAERGKGGRFGSRWTILFKGEVYGHVSRPTVGMMDEMISGLNMAYWHGYKDGQKDPGTEINLTFVDNE